MCQEKWKKTCVNGELYYVNEPEDTMLPMCQFYQNRHVDSVQSVIILARFLFVCFQNLQAYSKIYMEIQSPRIARIFLKGQTKDIPVLRLSLLLRQSGHCGKGLHEHQWDGVIPETNPPIYSQINQFPMKVSM